MNPLFDHAVQAFVFVSRWMWVVCILASLPMSAGLYVGGRYLLSRKPGWGELLIAGAKLNLIVSNLPWLIMGVGIHVGGVPTMHHFIAGSTDNPSILLFHASMVVPALVIAGWLVTQDLVGWLRAQGVRSAQLRVPVLLFKGFVVANVAVFTLNTAYMALWRAPTPLPSFLP